MGSVIPQGECGRVKALSVAFDGVEVRYGDDRVSAMVVSVSSAADFRADYDWKG